MDCSLALLLSIIFAGTVECNPKSNDAIALQFTFHTFQSQTNSYISYPPLETVSSLIHSYAGSKLYKHIVCNTSTKFYTIRVITST